MSHPGKLLYGTSDHVMAIKFVGDIRFANSDLLNTVLRSIEPDMAKYEIIIDLSELNYADSMILGAIISFFSSKPVINMVCSDTDFKKILYSIGLNQYFKLTDKANYQNTISHFKEVSLDR